MGWGAWRIINSVFPMSQLLVVTCHVTQLGTNWGCQRLQYRQNQISHSTSQTCIRSSEVYARNTRAVEWSVLTVLVCQALRETGLGHLQEHRFSFSVAKATLETALFVRHTILIAL